MIATLSMKHQLKAIRRRLKRLSTETDAQLTERSCNLQYEARSGRSIRSLVPDAFALLSETTRRVYSMVPYDVQLTGGIRLCGRTIVEMATGEGKSLTALLPLYVRALQGQGMLLATSNDYLAVRDAEFAAPVFERLGMTVGAIDDAAEDDQRREAYACDVTYGTAVQFGFDFLRDRAKRRFNRRQRPAVPEMPVGRGRLFSVLVDEADSLLIDEAATPLLIAGSPEEMDGEEQETFLWAAEMAPRCIEGQHYLYRKNERRIELTSAGRRWMHRQLPSGPQQSLSLIDYCDYVERAISVRRDFLRDRNYIVDQEEIHLVDEGTGRVGRGRQWSEGIQQAIQAKESLPITMPSGHLARVTVQSFFLAFEHLSGMTGTAQQARGELRANYKLGIRVIPTRLRNRRVELPASAFPTAEPWLQAILDDCRTIQQAGRSVLIGARNVAHSEMISAYLNEHGMPNSLLNARSDAEEAEIISHAGQPGRVTVATNMAGRGTDIKLHDDVRAAGGLHVILAGIHPSRRIDRQLIGRAGRQGDPGSHRRILCLEDDLLDEAFEAPQLGTIRRNLTAGFSAARCLALFDRAQALIARRNRVGRQVMFRNEKKHSRYLHQAGLDPLLDIPC